MTTRQIQGHLQELYGVEVSPTLMSSVTDAVTEEVRRWQNRPVEPVSSDFGKAVTKPQFFFSPPHSTTYKRAAFPDHRHSTLPQ